MGTAGCATAFAEASLGGTQLGSCVGRAGGAMLVAEPEAKGPAPDEATAAADIALGSLLTERSPQPACTEPHSRASAPQRLVAELERASCVARRGRIVGRARRIAVRSQRYFVTVRVNSTLPCSS